MALVELTDLLRCLPRGDHFRSASLPAGLTYVQDRNPCFVEPCLVVEDDSPLVPGETSAVLLAAPGAVGKSTLASEIAHRQGAALWDLSRIQVGSRTWSGTILEAYDFEATGVAKRLRQGDFLFVLDALDEGQVRAGSQNFDAFLSDLANALRGTRARPVVVMLARSDTADWIHLFLTEHGVPLARYGIAYFDRQQAEQFLDKRLDAVSAERGVEPVHREQRVPFLQARDALFALIYELFDVPEDDAWSKPRVRDFLGYAPVLEALADYLNVSNFMTLLRELQPGMNPTKDPWRFLGEIINRLLRREQKRTVAALRSKLEAKARQIGWHGWDELYGPDEQCSRILAQLIPEMSAQSPSTSLPPTLGASYEEALREDVPQHPFLAGQRFANVVFREYAYAWCFARGHESAVDCLRDTMQDRTVPFLPSHLFSRFVVTLSGGDSAVVDGRDFGVLYESLLSRCERSDLVVSEAETVMKAEVTLGVDPEWRMDFEVLETGGGLHFWRRLHSALVDVSCPVHLGLDGQRFLLGPEVDLDCSELVSVCGDIEVDARNGVNIRCRSYVARTQPLQLRVREDGKGRLTVNWPNVGYPWAAYRVSPAVGRVRLSDTLRGDTLRKFILMFRRQRTRKQETLVNSRWSTEQQQHRDELLELALRFGVIRRIEGRDAFEFNSEFATLKTLIGDSPSLSAPAMDFVAEYLGRETASRVVQG